MTWVSLERNQTTNADLSIEYAAGDETFEIYVNPSMDNDSLTSDSQKEDSFLNEDQDNIPLTFDSRSIFELAEKQKWARVFALVEENRELATMPFLASSASYTADSMGNILLHHVVKCGAPLEVVECVMNANPEAISKKGNDGYLPLHFACAKGAPFALVQKLVEAYPDGVKAREDRNFRLPLHLAVRREASASPEVMTLLMAYYPEATAIHDGNGQRPIDYAVKYKSTKARWESVAVLESGGKWINVAQCVAQRLEWVFDKRRKKLEKGFGDYIESLKEAHKDELNRIAEEAVKEEFDQEALTQELLKGQAKIAKMDSALQSKLEKIGDKGDQFLVLQEEIKAQKKKHEIELEEQRQALEERKKIETELKELLEVEYDRYAKFEQKKKEEKKMHEEAMAAKEVELEAAQQDIAEKKVEVEAAKQELVNLDAEFEEAKREYSKKTEVMELWISRQAGELLSAKKAIEEKDADIIAHREERTLMEEEHSVATTQKEKEMENARQELVDKETLLCEAMKATQKFDSAVEALLMQVRGKEAEMLSYKNEMAKKEAALEERIDTLQKGQRLKDTLIKRMKTVSQTKEDEANKRIQEMKAEVREQKKQRSRLLSKLRVFETRMKQMKEQIEVLDPETVF